MSEGELAELCSGIELIKTTATEEEAATGKSVGGRKAKTRKTAEETMAEGRLRWPQPPKITLKTLSEDPAIGIVEVWPRTPLLEPASLQEIVYPMLKSSPHKRRTF